MLLIIKVVKCYTNIIISICTVTKVQSTSLIHSVVTINSKMSLPRFIKISFKIFWLTKQRIRTEGKKVWKWNSTNPATQILQSFQSENCFLSIWQKIKTRKQTKISFSVDTFHTSDLGIDLFSLIFSTKGLQRAFHRLCLNYKSRSLLLTFT